MNTQTATTPMLRSSMLTESTTAINAGAALPAATTVK